MSYTLEEFRARRIGVDDQTARAKQLVREEVEDAHYDALAAGLEAHPPIKHPRLTRAPHNCR